MGIQDYADNVTGMDIPGVPKIHQLLLLFELQTIDIFMSLLSNKQQTCWQPYVTSMA